MNIEDKNFALLMRQKTNASLIEEGCEQELKQTDNLLKFILDEIQELAKLGYSDLVFQDWSKISGIREISLFNPHAFQNKKRDLLKIELTHSISFRYLKFKLHNCGFDVHIPTVYDKEKVDHSKIFKSLIINW